MLTKKSLQGTRKSLWHRAPLRVSESGLILAETYDGYLHIDKLPIVTFYIPSIFNINTGNTVILPTTNSFDMNDQGTVVFHNGVVLSHGFTWDKSNGLVELDGLAPMLINNKGTLVGQLGRYGNSGWNIQIDIQDPWVSVDMLLDINESDQIVGWGTTKDGKQHALLLTPKSN